MATASNRKRATKAADNTRVAALVEAAKIVALAQRGGGDQPSQTHCVINGRMMIAYDGVLTVGMPIEEEFTACPNTKLFLKAMQACGDNFTLTLTDPTTLTVKSGKFRAKVPCLLPRDMAAPLPDSNVGPCGQALIDTMLAVGVLATEGAAQVLKASLYVDNGTVTSTNGNAMLQAYHGTHLPRSLILPKSFAVVAAKMPGTVIGFGFSVGSFTLHYSNGSFLKCQRFVEGWPDPSVVLDRFETLSYSDIPDGFVETVARIAPFSENGDIYLSEPDKAVSSGPRGSGPGHEEFDGLPTGVRIGYSAKSIADCAPFLKRWDVTTSTSGVMYFANGSNVRGAIVGIKDT
ncbi:replicative clamp [Achromobacter phage phiAxp-1]|uniref:DNA polymerase processivity factor n=1 Tax=Achromobacter phage phiAxp-1 TaxID=1610509 RepID=UPI000656567F|nr:DNA polymerase processivity factor [Achromobacter phage phiAxp-1]AKJ71388.1 replicative clamp [Achromobacter phage phiAxp-1]